MTWTKEEYKRRERAAVRAFVNTAKELGKGHSMTRLMGSLAWGRHPFERGPSDQGLKDCIYAAAGLDGMYQVLNMWGREYDTAAQRVLIDQWNKALRGQ